MSGYAIVGEWLVEETGECTCGTGGMDGYGHERGCGQEPIYKVDELLSNYRAQIARAERAEAENARLRAALDRVLQSPEIEYRSDPHIIVNPEGDQRELARAQETIKNANAARDKASTDGPIESPSGWVGA